MSESKYFLPYQVRKIKDTAQIQIWEKSRRIGATYAQAYEDVRDLIQHNFDVWFSSADESAGREYILYCEKWVRILHGIAQNLGEIVIDSDKNIKAFVIEFANGKRISALSSNPRRFRLRVAKSF
jgi:phage FluMu gp28-like protein